MRISDWSSDVCSSDLDAPQVQRPVANTSTSGTLKVVLAAYRDAQGRNHAARVVEVPLPEPAGAQFQDPASRREVARADRKSAVSGKSVSVRVVLGVRRIVTKQNKTLPIATNQ